MEEDASIKVQQCGTQLGSDRDDNGRVVVMEVGQVEGVLYLPFRHLSPARSLLGQLLSPSNRAPFVESTPLPTLP